MITCVLKALNSIGFTAENKLRDQYKFMILDVLFIMVIFTNYEFWSINIVAWCRNSSGHMTSVSPTLNFDNSFT